MDTTASTQATTGVGALVGLAGLALTGLGIVRDNLPYVIGGSCSTLTALGVISLVLIRCWIMDTRDVRLALAASQREAERERSRYVAAQAALENEQGRLNRDMATERQRIAGRLIEERAAMRADFEEKKATLVAETMEATFLMFHNGKLAPDTATSGRLIQFPQQAQPAPATERARSRDHGVVGP